MQIPTWVNVLLLLAAFQMTSRQYYKSSPVRRIRNPFFVLLISCITLIALNAFMNEGHPWRSTGFLVLSLICFGTSLYFWRLVPPTPPNEPQD